jgi:uncharacterized phage-associated protein
VVGGQAGTREANLGMARVDDVAADIVRRLKRIDTFKLQKLVYYSQAWHLVWEDEPLFQAPIEAWANGPVVPALYRQHRRMYRVSDWPSGDPSRLKPHEVTTIDAVVDFYGGRSGQELAELTHREDPWLLTRSEAGLAPGDRGRAEIPLQSIVEYYEALA